MSNLVRLVSVCLGLSFFLASEGAIGDEGFAHCQEARPVDTPHSTDHSLAESFTGALKSGQIALPLLLALLAGLLTSLSPCVYPLIPITLSIMGARAYENHLHGFLVAGAYVLGMSIVYSALGAIFASLGFLAGSLMQSTAILLIFALLFLVMALAMLGAFELVVPASLLGKVQHIGGRGFKGAFLMGLVAGVIAAPCTGPVLGAILALIAYDQNLVLGTLLMFSFSLGLGLPFLGLGAFSSALAHLPKSGPWMNGIKLLFGSAMLGASIYYLAQAWDALGSGLIFIAQQGYFALIIGIIIALILIIIGYKYNIFKFFAAGLFSLLLASLLYGQGFNLGPKIISDDILSWHVIDEQVKDQSSFNELLTQADQSCKPVLIDFYADWCVACRELSSFTFSNKAVKERLSRYFLIKVDASKDSSILSLIHRRYNITGLPTILILDRSAEHLPASRIMGFVKPEEFLKALQ